MRLPTLRKWAALSLMALCTLDCRAVLGIDDGTAADGAVEDIGVTDSRAPDTFREPDDTSVDPEDTEDTAETTVDVNDTPLGGCLPLPKGAVAWWRADGTLQDSIGGSDAVSSPACPNDSPICFDTSSIHGSTAFVFKGSNELTVDAASLPPSPFTIEFWFAAEPLGDGVQLGLVDASPTAADRFILLLTGTSDASQNQLTLYVGSTPAPPTIAVPTRKFQHVALTSGIDGKATVFVNGRPLPDVASASPPLHFKPGPLHFGLAADPAVPIETDIDEITIYDSVLSNDVIDAIYKADKSGKCKL